MEKLTPMEAQHLMGVLNDANLKGSQSEVHAVVKQKVIKWINASMEEAKPQEKEPEFD